MANGKSGLLPVTDRETHRETDRKTNRWIERQTDGWKRGGKDKRGTDGSNA